MAPAARRLGRGLRLRHRLHGHRSRRPDPQADRRRARRDAEPDLAALHELHGDHGSRDARRRRDLLPDRRKADPAHRSRPHRRLRRARRRLRHDRRHRRLPRRVGPGQCALRRHRPLDDRRRLDRHRRPGSRLLRGGPRAGHRRRPDRRRTARRDLLAGSLLRRRGAHDDRARRHRLPPADDPAERTAHVRHRPPSRPASPGPAHRRPDRALLQHGLLHPARLHTLPARHGRRASGLGLLRLGSAARSSPRCCSSQPTWR